MQNSGIYQIQSFIKPEYIYIGSACNIKHRIVCHLHLLRKNIHDNNILQNHFNKYGELDFQFLTKELCLKKDLIIREQYYINTLKPHFNILKIAGNCTGRIASEETRKKQSEIRKGKYIGKNHSMFGKHHTEESKQKISCSKLGKKQSQTWILKRIAKNTGKKRTDETKQKMSRTQKMKDYSYKIGKCINSKISPFYQYIKDNIRYKTQTAIASELNISQSTISKLLKEWENQNFYH